MYRKQAVVLIPNDKDSEKIVNILEDAGYDICLDEESEDGKVFSILEEIN